jgi:hypothetical protein
VHIARLINQRAADGVATRLVKVKAHAGDPLKEAADTLASDAAELGPSQSQEMDPEGVHFGYMGALAGGDVSRERALAQVGTDAVSRVLCAPSERMYLRRRVADMNPVRVPGSRGGADSDTSLRPPLSCGASLGLYREGHPGVVLGGLLGHLLFS